jgi:superfamily II DNA or RNA helicase
VAGLNATQRDLLALLALDGPANITNLTALANSAGLRETPTRQLSTATLKPHIEALLKAALVHSAPDGFYVQRGAKFAALRDAHARQRLNSIALAVSNVTYHSRSYPGSDLLAHKALFELDVALATQSDDLEQAFERAISAGGAVSETPDLLVALRSVFPAVALSFDPLWFEALPEAVQPRLLELAARFAEVTGQSAGEIYPYLLARPALLSGQPALHLALFSLSILSGDVAGSEELVRLSTGEQRALLESALAAASGRFDAEVLFVPLKKQERVGVARLLQALLLLARGSADDIAAAKRIAQTGARKGSGFRGAAGWLKEMIELATEQNHDSLKRALDSRLEVDCLEALFRGTFAVWADLPLTTEFTLNHLSRSRSTIFGADGQRWLEAQMRACITRLETMRVTAPRPQQTIPIPKARSSDARLSKPLYELRTAKERWQLSLEALERFAETATPDTPGTQGLLDERIVWRVSPLNMDIEPYLQTRKGTGFTRGRKLAIKHLLPGSGEKQLERLPPEDRAVAASARERREVQWGYPQVFHYFERDAWLSLVGHPRVEYQQGERPVEVARGTVQIVARVIDGTLAVKLEPPDLQQSLEVREEGGRLLVYAVDEQARPLLSLFGSGLTLPLAVRERALASLGRLAHLLPIQTSESSTARRVPADPRLWLRVVPRSTGLLVTASVRPLGPAGPVLVPGIGAGNLLGHQGDGAVQTERDLGEERARLMNVLTQCPMLAGLDVEGESVLLEDAETSLMLLSALQLLEADVVVEWPEGTPLKLRARVGRGALRARISLGAAHFFAAGTLEVDDSLSLELAELVSLISDSPGRFARLANGDFIELERELRETLELVSSARVDTKPGPNGVTLSRSAFAAISQLSAEGSGFELAPEVSDYRAQIAKAFTRDPKLPRGLEAELRDYQQDGFRWLARLADAELSGCLADDMGLGKTLQAIALLLYRGKLGPALVVAPTSVCDNWRREIARFAPSLDVRYFQGPDRERELNKLAARSVVITSYALLQLDSERLRGISFATAILDEAQLIKNAESQRARAACALDAKVRFALTGTPVENHVGDLYSIFRFLLPDLVGTWPAFSRRFGASRSGEAGAQARRSLKRLLKPYLLRRTKAQVLEELPPLTEIEHRVTLGPAESALYEGIRRKALSALEDGVTDPKARLRVLAEITRLRRLCCHPQLVAPNAPGESSKIDALMGLIGELSEGGHRALVFSQFVDVLGLVRARLEEQSIPYQYLDGATPPARRSAAVDAFQAGEGDVFLISLKAGGFGLNLTAADYVIHVDPWWNPAVEAQASDRAHRIGQTRPVTVYRLIATGTIEERIVELHRKKRDLADSLLDESHAAATLGAAELRALLEA